MYKSFSILNTFTCAVLIVVSVGFEKPVFWNYEDDGEITVRVVMAGRSDIPITVLFSTQNVHALGRCMQYMACCHMYSSVVSADVY